MAHPRGERRDERRHPREGGSDAPRPSSRVRVLAGVLVRPVVVLRRWLLWPHTVRGWWATLARDLAPADLYHAFGTLTIAAALAARGRSLDGPGGATRGRRSTTRSTMRSTSNAALGVPRPILRRRRRIETGWARAADATVTVNDELARTPRPAAGAPGTPLLVVPNVPEPPASPVEPVDLRSAAGLPDTVRVVLFQGRLGPGLGLEAAADAVLQVPDAALVLLGFGRGVAEAQARDRDPRYRGRHVTLAARHPDELLAWTAAADVAIIPLPPLSANQRASTPNKFWEALASGTPVVVVSGLTAMERLVREHDLGAVAASASSDDLAAAIRVVLDRLAAEGPAWRTRIAALAAERFAWPPVATAYRSLVRGLVQPGARAGESNG